CSAVGAGAPERRDGPLREFLAAKHHAERRLERLDMSWTILRFGRLTDETGNGRIETVVPAATPVTLARDGAALTVAEALERNPLARLVVNVGDGDRHVADALDGVAPHGLPRVQNSGLGAGQSENAAVDPEMLFADASPLDADVDFEGD